MVVGSLIGALVTSLVFRLYCGGSSLSLEPNSTEPRSSRHHRKEGLPEELELDPLDYLDLAEMEPEADPELEEPVPDLNYSRGYYPSASPPPNVAAALPSGASNVSNISNISNNSNRRESVIATNIPTIAYPLCPYPYYPVQRVVLSL